MGGSYFLSRLAGQLGLYLGLTGLTINAADALYTGLADVYLPEAQMGALLALFESTPGEGLPVAIKALAAPFQAAGGRFCAGHGARGAGPPFRRRLRGCHHGFAGAG